MLHLLPEIYKAEATRSSDWGKVARKRFDLEGSHVVAFITSSAGKGLMTPAKATNRVRPILMTAC